MSHFFCGDRPRCTYDKVAEDGMNFMRLRRCNKPAVKDGLCATHQPEEMERRRLDGERRRRMNDGYRRAAYKHDLRRKTK